MAFKAKYRDICEDCESSIDPGDHVEYRDSGLCHVDCDDPDYSGTACPVCWLRHPEGACDRD